MKKIVAPFVLATLFAAVPVLADDTVTPAQPSEVIPLGPEHDRLCTEAISLQERRIRDLKAAVEYDKKLERDLIEGAKTREADAAVKEEHAKKWHEAAERHPQAERKRSFHAFASWLEGEARTDRKFAQERREAARVIGKGWSEAEGAIRGHEAKLNELRTGACASGG